MKAEYIVVIKTEPHKKFQTYVNFDTVWDTRAEAIAARERARKLFYDAEIRRLDA